MRKKVLVGCFVAAAAVILAAGIYLTWWHAPLRPPRTLDEAIKVVGSDQFLHRPKDQREQYLQQARLVMLAMPDAQRRQLHTRMGKDETAQRAFQEAMREFLITQAKLYAAVPVAQRTMILDMIIQHQEQQHARHQKELAQLDPKARSDRSARQARHREDFRKFLREGNPQMAGLLAEFVKTLNDRRKQKGLPEF